MSYSVYFKFGRKIYKLPVNPEEIKRSRTLVIETYQVLKTGQVSIPTYSELEQYSFEAEFPSQEYPYLESGAKADADFYEKMFRKAQKNKKAIRFIASNGITDDISAMVLAKSVSVTEKAGEEGDKYISLTLMEYKAPGKRYVAVTTPTGTVKQEDTSATETTTENPAVTEGKTHTVQSGDTLWGLAKKYYGNGAQYPKIASANSIANPNVISVGQVLTIPT
jgi:LysM repeat protein